MSINKISISHICLCSKDQLLFRNLCRLTNSVMGQFRLLDSDDISQGDVLIIDADVAEAHEEFLHIARYKQFQAIIAITQEDDLPVWLSNAHAINRPLTLRKVTNTFETVLMRNHIESSRSQAAYSILVVDDALPVRTFMKQRLHDFLGNKVAVDLACNGEEAIALAQKTSYQMIFLDVVMPGLDGYQVCRELKRFQSIPVVMLTSKGSTLNKVKAKMSGADGFVTKPPSDQELTTELEKFIPSVFNQDINFYPQFV